MCVMCVMQLVTPLPATASPTPAPWSQWYPPPPPVSPTAAPKSSTVVEGMSNLTFYLIVFIGGGACTHTHTHLPPYATHPRASPPWRCMQATAAKRVR